MRASVIANSWRVLRPLVVCSLLTTVGCGFASDGPGDVTTYDAGYVLHERTPELSHVFRFTNTSRRRIAITKVTKSCSCSQVSVDRTSVEPGDSAQVSIVVAVPEVLVKKIAACTIETDDAERKAVQYTVQFTSLPAGLAEPSEISVERSGFADGQKVVKSIDLISFDRLGTDDLESIRTEGVPGVDVTSVGSRQETDLGNGIVKRSRTVRLTISEKAYEARAASRGVILLTSPETRLHVSLPIMFRDPGNVEVFPSVVNFGVLGATDGSIRFVTLRLSGTSSSVEELRLESDSDALKAAVASTERAGARISLSLNAARLRSEEKGSSTAVAGAVRIRLRGTVVARVPWAALLR
jgi:hypothetical protein